MFLNFLKDVVLDPHAPPPKKKSICKLNFKRTHKDEVAPRSSLVLPQDPVFCRKKSTNGDFRSHSMHSTAQVKRINYDTLETSLPEQEMRGKQVTYGGGSETRPRHSAGRPTGDSSWHLGQQHLVFSPHPSYLCLTYSVTLVFC